MGDMHGYVHGLDAPLQAARLFADPFREGGILVLAERSGVASQRKSAASLFARAAAQEPMLAYEQEYAVLRSGTTDTALAGRIAEEHYKACLRAGIAIRGSGAGATVGLSSYRIGPCP